MPGRMFTLVGGALGALMLFAVGIAYAADGQGNEGQAQPFAWLDRANADKDDAISLEEMEAVREAPFNRFDRDGDGVVREAEIRATIQESVDRATQRMVRRLDSDRDGTITKDEFNRITRERFGWLDLNDDGKITEDELPRFARRMFR